MNILLDTHVAIWCLNDDSRLTDTVKDIILNPKNEIYYSVVSVWEVMLKHARKPKAIPFNELDFSDACKNAGFIPLGISEKHILAVDTLKRRKNAPEHNDPFDKLLLAQAKVDCLSFLTHDELIYGYTEKSILPF